MRQALTIAARDLRANFLTAFGLGSTAGFAAAAGVVLVGLAFVAVGLAVSAATSNPLVAAVGSLAVLLALWAAGIVSGGLTGWPRLALEELAPSGHVVGFLRGTLSTKDVVYFVSLLVFGVVTNLVVLEERR